MIEVFVHSHTAFMDVELAREMSQHAYCDTNTATRASEIYASKFEGRLLSDEEGAVLQSLAVMSDASEEIRIYDVARLGDRLKALSKGIRRTPVIVVNGEKYEGTEKCLGFLSKHCKKQVPTP